MNGRQVYVLIELEKKYIKNKLYNINLINFKMFFLILSNFTVFPVIYTNQLKSR